MGVGMASAHLRPLPRIEENIEAADPPLFEQSEIRPRHRRRTARCAKPPALAPGPIMPNGRPLKHKDEAWRQTAQQLFNCCIDAGMPLRDPGWLKEKGILPIKPLYCLSAFFSIALAENVHHIGHHDLRVVGIIRSFMCSHSALVLRSRVIVRGHKLRGKPAIPQLGSPYRAR
jgi:hypothetical protein